MELKPYVLIYKSAYTTKHGVESNLIYRTELELLFWTKSLQIILSHVSIVNIPVKFPYIFGFICNVSVIFTESFHEQVTVTIVSYQ